MISDIQLRTSFPWRAIVLAIVLFILSIFSILNFVKLKEYSQFLDIYLPVIFVYILLYILFFWNLTVLEFHRGRINIYRPFRLFYTRTSIEFKQISEVYYSYISIGVPRIIFVLKSGKRIRARYYQAGGRTELRKISNILHSHNLELTIKRYGSKKNP